MTVKKHPSVTAAELAEKLQANPDFVARKQAQEKAQSERAARIRVEEEPILQELREVGWDVQSVWDLVNTTKPYPEAITVLLKHLPLPYSDVVKEGIARSLAVATPEVGKAWTLLVEEYRKAPAGRGFRAPSDITEHWLGAKDGLACTLAAAVGEETLPELIALAKDPELGESRILLLSALKKRRKKSSLAQQAIAELANDSELQKEIASWPKLGA